MTTFDESWSGRLRKVSDLERPDHWYLNAEDDCLFFGEYTARGGYGHSSTNQLIHNLKKKPELAGTPQYAWKGRAIATVANAIRANLKPQALANISVVPIPPSKPAGTPGYDDRMVQVARAISPNLNVRDLLSTAVAREAAHAQQNHRDPATLKSSLALDASKVANPPKLAILLDDVLTTGCSFTVCKGLLAEVWPETQVLGLFVARRVIDQTADFDDLDL